MKDLHKEDKIWVKYPPEGKPNPGIITEAREDSVLANFDTYYDYVVPYRFITQHEKNIDSKKEEKTKNKGISL